jgi:hypothetical protein
MRSRVHFIHVWKYCQSSIVVSVTLNTHVRIHMGMQGEPDENLMEASRLGSHEDSSP